MASINIPLINQSGFPCPAYATSGAAGFDLRACISEAITLHSLERTLIPTGLYFEIPEGFEGQIRPRSGLAAKQGLTCLNTPGTIDSDYRGEVKVILVNLSKEDQTIQPGDRIAQMVIASVIQAELIEVNTINSSDRGAGGFGHTGKQ
jgi:dUTP pyrophosphatase